MQALITGGSGFIGAQLARLLAAQGQRPVLLDLQPPPPDLTDDPKTYPFVRASVTSLPVLIDTLREHRVDTVFHLGGMLSMPCEHDPWSAFEVNVAGTHHLMEAARLAGVERLILSSSIAVYGEDLPQGPIHDHSLQRPASMYGTSKVFGELLGRFYARRFGLDFRGLRIPSVVGPGSKVPHMSIYNCWAIERPLLGQPYEILVEPTTRCPTIYYKDAARALLELALAPVSQIKTKIYNINGFRPAYSAADLVAAVRELIPGARLSYQPDPNISALIQAIGSRELDDGHARDEWGWEPGYDLPGMIDDFRTELARLGREQHSGERR